MSATWNHPQQYLSVPHFSQILETVSNSDVSTELH